MATHSNILAWENSMDRGAWQATNTHCQESTKSRLHGADTVGTE